jgi:WD40 repeat protein
LRGYSDRNLTPYSEEISLTARFPAPYNLTYSIISDSSLRLTWQDSANFESSFLIEKYTLTDSSWILTGKTGPNEHIFTDYMVSYNTKTNYRITAATRKNTSLSTPELTATILLGPPQLISIQAINDHQVWITWEDDNTFESGFIVERMSTINPNWIEVGRVTPDKNGFIADSLTVGIEYSFRVKSYSSRYQSENSNSMNTQTIFPAPENLRISASTKNTVALAWDDLEFEEGYMLRYVAQDLTDTTFVPLGQNLSSFQLTDLDTTFNYHLGLKAYTRFNTSDEKTVLLQFKDNPKFRTMFPAHTDTVSCLTFSDDNRVLVSGGADYDVNIWSVESGLKITGIDGQSVGEPVQTLDFLKSGSTLAVGYQYSYLKLFTTDNWHFDTDINPITYRLNSAAASGISAKFAVSKYKYIYVWSTETWSISKTFAASDREIDGLVFENQGNWLASSSGVSDIKIWDTGIWSELQTLSLHTGAILSLDVSADDAYLASGSTDHQIIIWSTGNWTGVKSLTNHTDDVISLKFSADNKWLVSVEKADNRLFVWRTTNWELHTILEISSSSSITSIAFSPDAHYLAAGDSDGQLWLWRMESKWELSGN